MTGPALRIAFAGTPQFAGEHLRALLEAGHNVVAVYTQPDRPSGRGKKLEPSPVKALALEHAIPVFQPYSLKTAEAQEELSLLHPDLLIVVAYGLLLPQAVLDIPRFGCINVHASLLPRWRGAAPIERAILEGDRETGVTIMQMEAGLDTGPMLKTLSTPIGPEDNSETLTQRLIGLGRKGLLDVLEHVSDGSLTPQIQDDAQSTYARKLEKEEAFIQWERPADAIVRQINAFYPRSPAWCFFKGKRLKVLQAVASTASSDYLPGTILDVGKEGILTVCRDSSLLLKVIQLEGRKAASVADVLNGQPKLFQAGDSFTGHPVA